MVLLAVAVGVAEQGGVDLVSIGVVDRARAGVRRLRRARRHAARRAAGPTSSTHRRFSESPLLPAVILCLGLAAFAAQIGLAAIIGAFLAGMVVAETKDQHDFEEESCAALRLLPALLLRLHRPGSRPRRLHRRRHARAPRRYHRARLRHQVQRRLARRPRHGHAGRAGRRHRHGARVARSASSSPVSAPPRA